MEHSKPDSLQRFFWVDALRGVASLLIVVFHYHHFYLKDAYDRPNIPDIQSFPYGENIWPLYSHWAANAVELFWIISGFVFAHVYFSRPTSAREFFIARFARLYPLHFLTLIIVAVLQVISFSNVGHWQIYANNDARHFVLQIFMSANSTTLSRGLSFNGPIWSVSLEIFVYLIFFLSLAKIRKYPTSVSALLAASSWIIAMSGLKDLPLIRTSVFLCSGYFFLGTSLYAILQRKNFSNTILISVLSIGIALLGGWFGSDHLIITGVSLSLLSVAVKADATFPNLGKKLQSLGDMSYSLYLVHVPLQMIWLLVADYFFGGTRAFADSALTLPAYMLLSITVAHMAHRYFERPLGRAIRTRATRQKRPSSSLERP